MRGALTRYAAQNEGMKKGTGSWYTERGTVERPSSIPGMVELWRAGKFLALAPATKETK